MTGALQKALDEELQRADVAARAMQEDVAELLRALGLDDHARPMSPHEVVQQEILPAIRAIRAAIQGSLP